jgi:hypothetical protein
MKFQTKHAIAPVAGYVGPKTRAVLNTMGGTTGGTGGVIVPTGTNVSVALSYDSPAAGTLIAGQAVGDLAHFTFSNPTGTEAKVTKLTMNRTGISNDATLVNVYLFEGAKRVTDAASVSLTKITFNDASGLFTIPAGGMKTIAVKADILSGSNGQVIGVSLASVEPATVSGAFPILGANHSIATATMAAVTFSDTTTPSGTPTVDPQTDYTMWQNTVSFTTRAVDLKSLTFREIGSVATADLANFKLFVDGTQVGSTVLAMDANGYINFDITAAPKRIETGSHTIKVIGDIIGGSTKTFKITLEQAGDAVFMDSQLNQPVLVSKVAAGTAFSAEDAGTHTINAGTFTITKKSDSPAGNITLTASNALLAKYELKAAGEPIKVENFRISVTATGNGTVGDFALRNGSVFADGVQVGNTTALREDNYTGTAYTTYTFGSSLVVNPGTPVLLEIRGDIYNEGTEAITSTDTLTVNIAAGSSNLKRTKSLTYFENTASVANTLTVSVGALSGSKNASYANQTVVKPQTAYKLASFNIVSTDVENLNLDTIALTFTGSSIGVATGLSDVYVKYGTKTTNVKSTVASTTSSWSISETLTPNTTMAIEVWGNLTSSLVSGNTIITGVTISGTTANSASTVSTNAVTGQTITISTGSLAGTAVTDSSLATKLLVGSTQPKLASFRVTATNDTYTITDVAVSVADAAQGSFQNLILKATGMTDKIVVLNGSIATSSGMSLTVPANSSTGAVIDVYGNLADIGSSAATSTDIKITLAAVKARTSGGSDEYATLTSAAGNSMYAFKSIPTIALLTLPSTSLVGGGTKVLSKFSVTPDSSGAIGWKKLQWTMAKTDGVLLGATTTSGMNLKDSGGNVIAGTFSTTTDSSPSQTYAFASAATSGTLTFVANSEQQIATSETYSLNVSMSGDSASGDNIQMSIANPGTYAAPNAYATVAGLTGSFVWTDRSLNNHDTTTADWNNDYKVKNLPTDTQSLAGQT